MDGVRENAGAPAAELIIGGVRRDAVEPRTHILLLVALRPVSQHFHKAILATDPSKPHPWPIEEFLGTHPRALKFVQDNRVLPASFATEAFFSNDSFVFVNKDGVRQAGRYQIIPVAGRKDLSEVEAKARSADYLIQDLKTRLAAGPIQFGLVVQLPNAGDPTNDPSLVWPADRKTIDAGTISINSVVPGSAEVEKQMVFDPTHLTDGIELSDDPLPALRARVYSLSASHRQRPAGS